MRFDLWHEFGGIRCIHIKDRKDRRLHMNYISSRLKIPIEFYFAQRHFNGGVEGCYESHLNVMKESLDKKLKNVLILEDDVDFDNFNWDLLAEVIFFASWNTSWDVIYLGCFPDVWSSDHSHIRGHMYKIRATQTHAYVISEKFMQKMVKLPFNNFPIDEVFLRDAEAYAVLPSLFTQLNSKSDVSSVQWISMLSTKKVLTKAVEEYAAFVGIPLRQMIALGLFVCVAVKVLSILVFRKNGWSSIR